MLNLRSIGTGCLITLLLTMVSTLVTSGVNDELIIASGALGGFTAAWLLPKTQATDWKTSGVTGFHAAGLAGIILFFGYVVLLISGVFRLNGSGNIITSPIIIVVFAGEGLLAGLTTSGLTILYREYIPVTW